MFHMKHYFVISNNNHDTTSKNKYEIGDIIYNCKICFPDIILSDKVKLYRRNIAARKACKIISPLSYLQDLILQVSSAYQCKIALHLDHTDFLQGRFLSPIIVYRQANQRRTYRTAAIARYFCTMCNNTDTVSRRSIVQF